MLKHVANAFSLQMVAASCKADIRKNVSLEEAKTLVRESDGWTSVVGHADTAAVISGLLGVDVAYNRVAVTLEKGDTILVAQVNGRLPEGCTTLPEGVRLDWCTVTII